MSPPKIACSYRRFIFSTDVYLGTKDHRYISGTLTLSLLGNNTFELTINRRGNTDMYFSGVNWYELAKENILGDYTALMTQSSKIAYLSELNHMAAVVNRVRRNIL